MTATQIFGNGKILTLAIAKSLIGKRIICTSPEYRHNQPHVIEFSVGSFISEWDAYGVGGVEKEYNDGKYASRQDYWASYMTPDQINDRKNKILLLDEKREWQYSCHINNPGFEEPTFTGSDADRPVFFIEIPA